MSPIGSGERVVGIADWEDRASAPAALTFADGAARCAPDAEALEDRPQPG